MADIYGTSDDDTLFGTASNDFIESFGGSDLVSAGAGNDIVQGGTGNDFLWGQDGSDTLRGNEGDDFLYGDDLFSSPDVQGNDLLEGGEGQDYLVGYGGADRLDGGTGSDYMEGNAGDDTYVVNDYGDIVTEGLDAGGNDTVESYVDFYGGLGLGSGIENLILSGSNAITGYGNELDNLIVGNGNANQLSGDMGEDQIFGNAGNDTIVGGQGRDVLWGGDGDDVIWGDDASASLIGDDDVLHGGSGDDFLYGGDGEDNLYGDTGYDILTGGAGDDFLDGGNGFEGDQMWGGAGNDTYVVDQFSDQVFEAALDGVDTIQTSLDNYWLGWGSNVENLVLAGTEGRFAVGNELDNEMVGTVGSDFLEGRMGNDTLRGGDGDDSLSGGEGDDTLEGGAGNDVLWGDEGVFGEGQDVLSGGDGNDLLIGGAGNDILTGDAGSDQLFGDAGDDALYIDYDDTFNSVGDRVSGGSGIDRLYVQGAGGVVVNLGFAQVEQIFGGEGDDLFFNLNGVTADTGYTVFGNGGNDNITGGDFADHVFGGDGHDVIAGSGGADELVGGEGNDHLDIDAADTHVSGGAGFDTAYVQDSLGVTLDLGVAQIEVVYGGSGNDVFMTSGVDAIWAYGYDGDDIISGGIGNDTFEGGNGNDQLSGGAGSDTIRGGLGDDSYVVDDVGDTVTEAANEGVDTVQSSITYTLGTNVENLTLTGTSAINGTGNVLDNVLTGNSAANVLTGGAGDDTYIIGAGDSVVEAAGGGTDTVHSAMTYTLGAHVENLTLTGSSAINGTGNSLANVLVGNGAANTLAGGAGNDTYVVGAGDTVVESKSNGTDTVHSSVTWTLGSNFENLTLIGSAAINGTGNSGANLMIGNDSANVLSGVNGNDSLRGNAGNDTVNGGGGNDTYLFGRGEGQDLLQDSGGSSDKIMYDTGIDPIDLVISRQANDLRLAIHGSADYVTVQNWYTSSSNRTETIQTGNGQTLLSTQVDQLIQAMTSFTQQTGLTWDQAIDQQPQEVQNILTANWQ